MTLEPLKELEARTTETVFRPHPRDMSLPTGTQEFRLVLYVRQPRVVSRPPRVPCREGGHWPSSLSRTRGPRGTVHYVVYQVTPYRFRPVLGTPEHVTSVPTVVGTRIVVVDGRVDTVPPLARGRVRVVGAVAGPRADDILTTQGVRTGVPGGSEGPKRDLQPRRRARSVRGRDVTRGSGCV